MRGFLYLDGGLLTSNPAQFALAEANSMHQYHPAAKCPSKVSLGGIRFLISIGAGKGADQNLSNTRTLLQRSLRGMAPLHDLKKEKDPEHTHGLLDARLQSSVYYRFNVQNGLEGMGLYEVGARGHGVKPHVNKVCEAVAGYVSDSGTKARLKALAEKLVEYRHQKLEPLDKNKSMSFDDWLEAAETKRPQEDLSQTRSHFDPDSKVPLDTDHAGCSSIGFEQLNLAPSIIPITHIPITPEHTRSSATGPGLHIVGLDNGSIAETVKSAEVWRAAASEVVKAFTNVPKVSASYDYVLKRIDKDYFVRNHLRLLKFFYLGSAQDAKTWNDDLVARFFRTHEARKMVSDGIVSASSNAVAERNSDLTSTWAESTATYDGKDIPNINEPSFLQDEGNDELQDDNSDDSKIYSDATSSLAAAATAMTEGRAFSVYQNNIVRFAHGFLLAPASFKAALDVGDVSLATQLLNEETDAVTQPGFEFTWISEPLEIGLTPTEVIEVIMEEKSQAPWICYDSPALEHRPLDTEFHRHNCIHSDHPRSTPESDFRNFHPQQGIEDLDTEKPSRETIDRLVAEMCGLAGVIPSFTSNSWNSHVALDDVSARITYCEDAANDLHSRDKTDKVIQRTFDALSRLTTIIAWLQRNHLICDHFVALTVANQASCAKSVVIPFNHIVQLQASLEELFAAGSDTRSKSELQDSVLGVSFLLLEKVCGRSDFSEIFKKHDPHHISVDACALAVQALCVGLLAFSQANIGELRPFFLQHGLSKVCLRGADGILSARLSLTFQLESLTCLGDMLNSPVMVFRCGSISAGNEFHLQSSLANLFELWGPGNMIVDRSQPSARNICGAQIGGGLLYQLPDDPGMFHWSRGSPSDVFTCDTRIGVHDPITIGALYAINPVCPFSSTVDQRPAAERTMPTLETTSRIRNLGTYDENWALREAQVGSQAGQYAVFCVNLTWVKSDAGTKKTEILSGSLNLNSLEHPWGVLVSVCTGVAQRVPLREVLAEAMIPMVEAWGERPVQEWRHLLSIGIVEEFRKPTFRTWLDGLADERRKAVISIASYVLRKICWTGVNNQEQLVVACPTPEDDGGCIHIPCKDNQVWANILRDSPNCATFACLTWKCIETDHHKCRNIQRPEWHNKTSLLITSVCQYQWLNKEEKKVCQQRLERGKAYWMGYYGNQCRFVARVSTGLPTILRVSESTCPAYFGARVGERMARMRSSRTKLEEKRLKNEKHAEDVLLLHGA